MHSHHSHSGDYISHASGTLEEMVATAAARGFTHYCLTEHMPRLDDLFLYPEEADKAYTFETLLAQFDKYAEHARALQKRVNAEGKMKVLVGYEVEGIDRFHIDAAKELRSKFDMCVGSVHHVHGIPIDYDTDLWLKARDKSAGRTRDLYLDYFLLQQHMLFKLNPEVVGHFDLIRLFELDDVDPTTNKKVSEINLAKDWPEVWRCIVMNVQHVVSYGGLFELNSAALRKGWASPYPRADIARLIHHLGGKFCLSDDAHTYEQVGLNYSKMWDYVTNVLELDTIYHLDKDSEGKTIVVGESVAELSKLPFWTTH